jgi:hypothetical protein
MRQAFVGVRRIHHVDRHARIALDVSLLLAALGGIDQDVLAVGVHPNLGVLGRAIGHEGCELAKGRLLE